MHNDFFTLIESQSDLDTFLDSVSKNRNAPIAENSIPNELPSLCTYCLMNDLNGVRIRVISISISRLKILCSNYI
jgi:hypothetical protein